jgi:hypothetical protein
VDCFLCFGFAAGIHSEVARELLKIAKKDPHSNPALEWQTLSRDVMMMMGARASSAVALPGLPGVNDLETNLKIL